MYRWYESQIFSSSLSLSLSHRVRWSGWPLSNIFLTFTTCCISLGARNFVRSDSRSAVDTVGVNGIYVPVECILIIRGGIFEAATQYVRTWNFHTARHVCVTIRSWWLRFIRISGSLIRLVLSSRYISNGKRYCYLNTLAFIWKLTSARRYIIPRRLHTTPQNMKLRRGVLPWF